jgi:hypothetical protein
MSSLYFGLDVFCQFEARVPEVDTVFSVQCTLFSPQLMGSRGCVSNSETQASNMQNTARPKYNDDISLLISQYLISDKSYEGKATIQTELAAFPCIGMY